MKPSRATASHTQKTRRARVRRNVVFDNLVFPPTDYSLDLHAKIAALLLEGDEFERAAERALLLLNICSKRLAQNKTQKETRRRAEADLKRLNLRGESLPFARGVKIITGQSKIRRAEADFLTFLECVYPPWTKLQRTQFLRRIDREGFTTLHVVHLKSQFDDMRAAGELGQRWLNRKTSGRQNQAKKRQINA